MTIGSWWLAAGIASIALGAALAAAPAEEEAGKRGGTLTYVIPEDAPPSFDGHREGTFATLHSVAPFYSVLIRVNPENPSSTTDFVCDLCTAMPHPTDGGKTYTFKIRGDVKFHDGSLLTAADVAKSWQMIIDPPEGVLSARRSWYEMVDKVESPDPSTVVFHLKFATDAFLPALADPFTFIYKKEVLDRDPRWYEKNILGSGPFKFAEYDTGQAIKGVRNPDYYRKGLPYLDGFSGIYAPKQAVRVEAIRSDRAAIEFRGLPPSTLAELKKALDGELAVQESDWNCGNLVTPNHRKKPFDDPRVRRALTLAIDRWHGAPALSKIANVRTVGGIVFPASPLAATKEELQQIAGFWPDIEKSRAEAKRLLKEAGAEGLSFELLNRRCRPAVQICRHLAGRRVEQDRVARHAARAARPARTWTRCAPAISRSRSSPIATASLTRCWMFRHYLPKYDAAYGYYQDQAEVDLYDKMLRETDFARQRDLMRQFEKYVVDQRGPSDLGVVVVSYRPLSVLCEGLEDQSRAITSTRIWRRCGSINNNKLVNRMLYWEELQWTREQRIGGGPWRS